MLAKVIVSSRSMIITFFSPILSAFAVFAPTSIYFTRFSFPVQTSPSFPSVASTSTSSLLVISPSPAFVALFVTKDPASIEIIS